MLLQILMSKDASSDFSNFCFALPYESNTSTFLSLKTIKLEETRNNERARHEVFIIEKDRYLQLDVKACCLHN